jgi:hypothetical protein
LAPVAAGAASLPAAVPPQCENQRVDHDAELELYGVVAERLKQAHALVRQLAAPEQMRRDLTRRLLVITDAAKRDLPSAARRLDRFIAELTEPQEGH